MPNIYVLSKDNIPLMPMHSYGRARQLLKAGRAVIVRHNPFTIRLTYDIKDAVVDECLLGIDPGRTNIGLCVTDSKGRVLFASDVETRNRMIAKLMLERKLHRQASRRGERLRRQRRAIAADKTGLARHAEYRRMLPGCEEPVCCKVMRNSKSRFLNRARPLGWLTPTASHLLQTHLNIVRKIQKILPVSRIVIEINRFDFQRMENPGIRNWDYQSGKLSGFKSVYDAVDFQQENHCLLCGKADIVHYHHLIPVHKGGSNLLENYAGLCEKCHVKVHTECEAMDTLLARKHGLQKKYHALSVLNQIMPKLLQELSLLLPTYVTTGYETKCIRKLYSLKKDHFLDAWCVAVSVLDTEPDTPVFTDSVYGIRQFRRHNRAIINNQRERTYRLYGKIIARNRRPRFEQSGPALSDAGLSESEISRLSVTPSLRRYNTKGRLQPGAVLRYRKQSIILSGQLSNGQYYRAVNDMKTNYPSRDCIVLCHNAGLVFM